MMENNALKFANALREHKLNFIDSVQGNRSVTVAKGSTKTDA